MRNLPHHIWHAPRNAIALLLRGYQRTLSLDHGPMRHLYGYGYCRHSPTCSQYAIDMVTEHGATLGTIYALKRVLTCHPWRKPDDKKILETVERHFPRKR